MARIERDSLSITFDAGAYEDDGQGGGPLLVVSSRVPDADDYLYYRAHGTQGHTMHSTSGSVSREQSNLRRFTSEFVVLQGSAIGRLQYPKAESVSMEIRGNLIGIDGQVVSNPGVYFDAAKNAVASKSGPVYGIIEVEYQAPYDLWRAKFGGSCPSTVSDDPVDVTNGSPDDDQEYVGRTPMLVYTTKEGEVKASLNLVPPPCKDSDPKKAGIRFIMGDGAAPAHLQIEVDADHPPRYAQSIENHPLGCKCRFRVYPATIDSPHTVAVTAGKATRREVRSGRHFVKVKQILNFAGQSSLKLDYQVANSPAVKLVSSRFVDAWGRTFTPDVRLPGDTITAVEWLSQGRYRNPEDRTLEQDEVAVANAFGNALPCYGVLEIEYQASYDLWDLDFQYKVADSGKHSFEPAYVIAKPSGEDQGVHIRIDPPSSTGVV